jgi:hypothetical protein
MQQQAASDKCPLEIELCNGDQVKLVSGLRADKDFVTCLMKGRGKTFGSWLFARRSYPPRSYQATHCPLLLNPLCSCRFQVHGEWLTDNT